MQTQLLDTKLGSIEYRVIGKGTPIVFLHGGHSNSKEFLSHKGFDLTQFQLITPSRPGYGQTPLSRNKTPRQAAALIATLLEELALPKVVLYGISAGGLTAIELASNYPGKVSKLVLASAVTKKWLDQKDATYKIAQKLFHPRVEKITWGMVRFFAQLFPGLIAKGFYPQFSKHPLNSLKKEEVKELMGALQHYQSKEGFLNDLDQYIEEDVITRIKCPTLIIHSTNDNSVSLVHPKHAKEHIENSRLELLQNEWGHLFWIGSDAWSAIEKIIAFIKA